MQHTGPNMIPAAATEQILWCLYRTWSDPAQTLLAAPSPVSQQLSANDLGVKCTISIPTTAADALWVLPFFFSMFSVLFTHVCSSVAYYISS